MLEAIHGWVKRIRRQRNSHGRGLPNVRSLLRQSMEERDRLWENPPPCASVIRYVPDCIYEESRGEFLFNAADVEKELKNILHENPHLANNDEGAILNWVQGRDKSLPEPTDVPPTWSRFKYVAIDLAKTGKAKIYCRECEADIGSDEIDTADDRGKPSWNFDRVVCPHRHNLLVVETVHLVTR